MDVLDFTMLENQLTHGKVKIEFIKTDGTYRIMICTKSSLLIKKPFVQSSRIIRNKSENILRVFDLEKNEWRSMRKDRIIQWQLEP